MKKFSVVLTFLCASAWFGFGPEAEAQGTKVIDKEITWSWSPYANGGYGFYWWHRTEGGYNIVDYGNMSTTDWSNYYNGEFTFRFEVLQQPTSKPFLVEFGIWQANPSGGHRAEQIAPRKQISGGVGSVWTGSLGAPSSWWVHPDGPGPVDFSSPETFERLGLVLRNPNPFCIPAGPEWGVPGACPEYQGDFFTMRARVTIYAYPSGGGGPTSHTVSFNVKDESSAAISGATISINGGNLSTNTSGQATVDLTDGTYNYTVSKSGFANKSGTVTVSGGNVSENVTLSESVGSSYTVTFNVSDGNNPIQGANVNIDGGNYATNASGVATVNLMDGNYSYTVSKAGYNDSPGTVSVSGGNTIKNVVLSEQAGGSGETVTFELKMERYNAAVVGAKIFINGAELTTDSNGKATINLANGTYPYEIIRSGFDDVEGEVVVSGSPVTKQHTLQFGLYPITFTVTDEASNKIQGATISIPDVQKTKDEDGNVVYNVAEVVKTTDANGQAVFEVMNDTYSYTVSKSGYSEETGNVFISGEGDDVPVSLTQTGKTITFVIKDDGDNLLEGATVSVDGNTLSTNASGEASVVLDDGTYDYTASKSGYTDASGSVTVSGADLTENVSLGSIAYTVTFVVKDGDDNPVEGAAVLANGITKTTDASGETSFSLNNGSYPYTVSANDYDGSGGTVVVNSADETENVSISKSVHTLTFAVTADGNPAAGLNIAVNGTNLTTNAGGEASTTLISGSYPYLISGEGYQSISGDAVVSGADKTENVSLEKFYTLRFVVKNGDDPVEGASIDVEGKSVLTTDASGQASDTALNGTYNYTVTKTGLQEQSGSVTLNGANVVKNIDMSELPVDFTFVVTDEDAYAVEGATLTVNGESLMTASNGRAIASLTPGDYNYIVSKTGYDVANGSITVDAGGGMEFVTLIQTLHLLTFTVTDELSLPVNAASISVNGQTLTTDALGQASVDIPAGSYDYTVTAGGFNEKAGSVTVVDQDVTEAVVLEEAVYEVSFIVTDQAGSPVAGAAISFNGGELTTDAAGKASLYVNTGTYAYTVTADNYLMVSGSAVVLTSGITVNVSMQSTVNIHTLFADSDITIIPMMNSELRIRSEGSEFKAGFTFSVFSLEGKQIYAYKNDVTTSEVRFNLPEGKKGIYILQIKNRENQFYSKRFLMK